MSTFAICRMNGAFSSSNPIVQNMESGTTRGFGQSFDGNRAASFDFIGPLSYITKDADGEYASN